MAGIGFELIKLLREGTYHSVLRAYGLSTLIGAGPGLFILLSLSVMCFFTFFAIPTTVISKQFLTIIIYLFSISMILSSFLQYTFFRFIADKVFLKEFNQITPNLHGALFLQLMISVCFSLPITFYFFSDYPLAFKLLVMVNLTLLSLIWIITVVLTGLKSYHKVGMAFIFGYSAMMLLHFLLEHHNDLVSLLFEFLVAQMILFVLLLHAIIDYFPTQDLCKFDFLKKEYFYYTLVLANFFYNLGFWIDKYLFWFNPDTRYTILPPLSGSPLYDLPMFIAMLSIIPATAVFMLQLESQFSMIYPDMMNTIFKGKPLAEIELVCNKIMLSARKIMVNIMTTQAATVIMLFLCCTQLFLLFQIDSLHVPLLFILLIGISLQMMLWALINVLYYMTKYIEAMIISFIFLLSNCIFTLISLKLGPLYYGYGFTLSLLLSVTVALILLNKKFREILYFTFMMTD